MVLEDRGLDAIVVNSKLVVGFGGEEGEVLGGGELRASAVECEDGDQVHPELGEGGQRASQATKKTRDMMAKTVRAAEEGGPVGREGRRGCWFGWLSRTRAV